MILVVASVLIAVDSLEKVMALVIIAAASMVVVVPSVVLTMEENLVPKMADLAQISVRLIIITEVCYKVLFDDVLNTNASLYI